MTYHDVNSNFPLIFYESIFRIPANFHLFKRLIQAIYSTVGPDSLLQSPDGIFEYPRESGSRGRKSSRKSRSCYIRRVVVYAIAIVILTLIGPRRQQPSLRRTKENSLGFLGLCLCTASFSSRREMFNLCKEIHIDMALLGP